MLSKFLQQFNSERTKKCYRADISSFLDSRNAKIEAKPSEIISYVAEIKNKTSAATANRVLSSLKSYYRFLEAEEVINKNPAVSVKGFRTSVKAPTIALSDQQVSTILTLAKGHEKLVIALMAYLGLRRDEIRNALVADISSIPGTGKFYLKVCGKGDKYRQIPINDKVMPLLDEFKGEKYIIENSPEMQIGPNYIYRVVKKYGKIIGVDALSPHSFRATVISQMFEKGNNVRDIAQFAGHSSIVTTQGYDKKRDGLLSSVALTVEY